MKISVIIPTLNEEKYIAHLLTDLEKQLMSPHEVIVVDGQSTDKTKKIVKQYQKVKLYSTEAQVARQRNYGNSKAIGEILVFLDADVRLDKDFLKGVMKQFENESLDIACPFYWPYKSSFFLNFIYLFFNVMFFLFQMFSPSGAGSCIVCRRDVFEQGEGFRPEYKFEDIEMIRRYGYRFRFGMLRNRVYVSDRRFKKEGSLKLLLKYLILSVLFVTNQFKLANKVDYQFGKYS